MNMKSMITCGLVLLFSISIAGAQETFQGTVTYKYEIEGENAEMMASFMPEAMIVKYGETGMLTEMQGGMMAAMMGKIVVNSKSGETFVLKENEKSVYLMKEEDLEGTEAVDSTNVQKLDESKEILGYECRKYKVVSKQEGKETTQYMWVTDELKIPEMDMPGMQQLGNSVMGNGKIPGFPMQVEVTIPNMSTKLLLTVSELDFTKVDAKEFDRPEDYTVKDFSEMMKMGMGN